GGMTIGGATPAAAGTMPPGSAAGRLSAKTMARAKRGMPGVYRACPARRASAPWDDEQRLGEVCVPAPDRARCVHEQGEDQHAQDAENQGREHRMVREHEA